MESSLSNWYSISHYENLLEQDDQFVSRFSRVDDSVSAFQLTEIAPVSMAAKANQRKFEASTVIWGNLKKKKEKKGGEVSVCRKNWNCLIAPCSPSLASFQYEFVWSSITFLTHTMQAIFKLNLLHHRNTSSLLQTTSRTSSWLRFTHIYIWSDRVWGEG